MNNGLTAAERLIVAADPMPTQEDQVWAVGEKVLALAKVLKGTGVYIKVNSVLRACGYRFIDQLHDRGVRVFADLKLFDIPKTLEIDGALLRKVNPELLTVACAAGGQSMRALKHELPGAEVLGVTVLTSNDEHDSQAMFSRSTADAVLRFAEIASVAGVDGLISSPAEVEILRKQFGRRLTYNTPAIRPEWSVVAGDDQNPARIMTPARAIRAGADRIVVGRPITEAKDPRAAVMRTLDEIESAMG